MSRPTLIAILAGTLLASAGATATAQSTEAAIRLLNDVRYLSSDELGGRLTGQPGADSAASYIARRFKESGLRPSPSGWFQEFTVSPDAPIAKSSGLGGAAARNVIGVLPGHDPTLRDEIVIVGAHYDHLGPGRFGALDSAGPIHNGADDNASGTSALIHIARKLAASPPARTVVFLAFSGEEGGLLGSANYVKSPVFPLAATYAMVNMDMVGRLKNNRLIVFGAGTAQEFPALLDSLNNSNAHFDLKASGDGWGPSDHASFYGAGKPVLHVFTDLHEDYHRASDDWERIDADGLERVANFTAEIVHALADRKAPLTFINVPPPPPPVASASGGGASLGTIPDMTENPGGVRLTGVRAGSPAEQAGLRAGDIITGIGEMAVPDLQGMSTALGQHKPGDVVEVRFIRDGAEQKVNATLAARGR